MPVLAVVAAALVAALFSIDPTVSIVGTYGRYESFPMRLAYVGLLCGAVWIGERERTTSAFLVGCGVAAVEALYQAWTHSPPRPDGNLGQPNLLGAVEAMAIPLCLDRARRAGPPPRRFWLAVAFLCGLALAVSSSRSGWLGALVGVCVLAIFSAGSARRRAVMAVAVFALAGAAVLVLVSPLRNLNSDPPGFRLGIWRDSLSVIAERPLTGWGEDTMGLVFGRHQTGDWVPGSNIDRAHSMPLDLVATQGVLGLGACTWLFGVWWLGVWRQRDLEGAAGLAGAAAAYLASAALNFDWAPATAGFWLLAGAAWPGAPRPPPRVAPALSLRMGLAGTMASAGLVAALVPMVADVAYYRGNPARAAALDPWQPRYQVAEGSLTSLRRAAAIGDPDPSTYVALGEAEARAGNHEASQAAYGQALNRYPYDADARQRLSGAWMLPIEILKAASG